MISTGLHVYKQKIGRTILQMWGCANYRIDMHDKKSPQSVSPTINVSSDATLMENKIYFGIGVGGDGMETHWSLRRPRSDISILISVYMVQTPRLERSLI